MNQETKSTSRRQPIFQVDHLVKTFVVNDEELDVLKDLSFTIEPGTFTIIFGPSGSGKSTLLGTLMGLMPPTSGSVHLDGHSMYTLPPEQITALRAKNIGAVYQSNYWVGSLTAQENVALPLYLANQNRSDANKIAMEKLQEVGMEKYAGYNPTLLSGGQQQRVQMARALVTSPKIIVADEPTGNLDSKNGNAIMSLLSMVRTTGGTVVLVTHNLEYLSLSDHQIYLKDGEMTETRGSYTMPPDLMSKVQLALQTGQKASTGEDK